MLSLVADYSDTSSSSSSSDDDEELQQRETQKNKPTSSAKTLLPSANLLLSSSTKGATGVVFSNPFLEAEKAEIDKLQKHVKMVESEEHLIQKNGRKICWNNRKGRCRFGNKCKYAHDSDLVAGNDEEVVAKEELQLKPTPPPPAVNSTIVKSAQLSHKSFPAAEQSLDLADLKSKPRKRPGLGDSIVPGKKVMKQYQTIKTKTL